MNEPQGDGDRQSPEDGQTPSFLPIISPDIGEQDNANDMDEPVPTDGYQTLPITGLGGSAGSLGAMQTFFSAMPPDTGMAFVVVVHLSAEHESVLAAILQRSTRMPVTQVTAHAQVEPNHVYVIPPGKHLLMSNGHMTLSEMEPTRGKRITVDMFFRTLADTHGPHAAAIVFSGGDSDGSIGIKRIKERGGLTIAQDPAEAEHDSMPRSAIATGMVDWVLPVAEMPDRLVQYRQNEGRVRLPPEEPPAAEGRQSSEEALREVLAFLRIRTGRDFSYYKRATILRRIGRRMQVNNVVDIVDYLSFIRTHPGETGALLQDLLISVTNFFRDRDAFQALAAELPNLLAGKMPGDPIRVWVVACATGEEAYSLAMLLCEYADRLPARPLIQIFATDIDETAIAVAREGSYPETITADVSEERLRRFFTRDQSSYRVNREVREMVLFAAHDLLKDSPFSRLDLITCRNLLIYLNRDAQTRAFDIFHFALRHDGRLFLGSSESAEEARSLFTPVNKIHRIYARRASTRVGLPVSVEAPSTALALHARQHPPGGSFVPALASATQGRPPLLTASEDMRGISWEALHFKLIEPFVPPSVIVNGDYDIVHLSHEGGRYLRFTGGTMTVNLLRVVHPMLRVELRTALFRAAQGTVPVRVTGVVVELDGKRGSVDITVRPALELAADLFLVVFEERDAPESIKPTAAEPPSLVQHLEHEIEHLKEQLRDTVEQYEASTEELKASNEELQAINEELRSATEELETSREELQSINEELTTVNQELKSKVEEISFTNSDLQNLMASTHIATIFLDRQLRIKRYTPSAVSIFNLISTDIGRPLSDLRHRLEYNSINSDAQRVLEQLAVIECEVRDVDGRWFLARMLPYRTVEDQIAGVVLTFVDVTESKQALQSLRESEERLSTIFNQAAVGQAEIALDGRFLRVNDELCRILGRSRETLLAANVNEVTHPDDLLEYTTAWEKTIKTGAATSLDERFLRPDGNAVPANSSLSRLSVSGQHREHTILAVTMDLTQRVESAAALEKSRLQLLHSLDETIQARAAAERADKTKDEFLAVLSHELRTPLTPVLMAVQSVADDPDVPESCREIFAMIERNVLLETYLIDDLLDITRISRGKMEIAKAPLDVHDTIRKALDICSTDFAAKGQAVHVELAASAHQVSGDAVRLQQVFWNLFKNACKFTQGNGEIWVRSRNENAHIIVDVVDTGIGIESDKLPDIFHAFKQADPTIARKFGGLGLGLAISKATISAHSGELRASSIGEGQGSTFTVELPVTQPSP